jgi:UDP-3-O-[3-hydroxymyristoyl] glucosamine N-acyltransferase
MFEEFGKHRDKNWRIFKNGTYVHKTAIVESWVRFDDNCVVHPYAVVGRVPSFNSALAREPRMTKAIRIGKNTVIGCHAIVYSDVVLDDDCFVGDHALIREGSRIGKECMIGCHVSISYDCKIGDRSKFQNGTVFHGECGEDCFFGVGVVCSSDKRIDLNNYQHLGSHPPKIGNRVLVGSGANLLPEIEIGDDAVIGAGSIVVKSVEAQTLILGPIGKVVIPHVQV